ncbi:MAG: signal recognition particle-docking protein FtsY [Desulfofustis sp.]|jgi:fused signal recognition particle receptor|nr:signal recognition particle-docking protein FtsY [Desulfofustis sp.]
MLGWFRKKKKSPVPDSPEDDTSRQQSADATGEEPDATVEEPEITDPAVAQTAPPAKPPAAVVLPENPEKSSPSIFKKLSERLARTRESFTQRIDELFLGKKQIDAALFDELEEILVTADLGIATTMELLETARRQVKRDNLSDPQQLKHIIKDALKSYLTATNRPAELVMPQQGPFVIMVVGVNGVGKTTTIGKIGAKFHAAGRSVLLVAADTFRAAAISQLKIWGERNGARVIAQHEGADPSSVVFDAMAMAVSKDYDVVLIDTAGRLHTRANLMEELKKIKRVITKQLPDAPHEVLLVIDATTGQNGISQATLFNEAIGVTGIALTKLDGTAKGGIVANITRELQLPIRFIGVGEKIDDLRDFDADEFIEALFATESDDDHPSDQLHTSES